MYAKRLGVSMALVAGLGLSGVAQALVIATDLGTVAPPSTLGAYSMTPFADDARPEGTLVSSVASPLGGDLLFSPDVELMEAGSVWDTWSHGYTGDVYFLETLSGSSVMLTLPADTTGFYFYAQPNIKDLFTVTATESSGVALTVSVNGDGGANGFGFYVNPNGTLASITVTLSDPDADGFAVGEFGIANSRSAIPEPTTLALLGFGLAGLGFNRRRTH